MSDDKTIYKPEKTIYPITKTPDDVLTQSEWKIGDVIHDLYEITDILGEGGMGKVYKVHHRNWNIDLAVKSPLPEILVKAGGKENFKREAETWVNLGLHPHTVNCYYVRTLGDIPYVFAEFMDGGSLKNRIETGRLYEGGSEKALERILDIAIQFAWGLDFAHEQGLVHQDIKPANVMMMSDGTSKLTDFGLAKARPMPSDESVLESNRSILVSGGGMTRAYCSPEQAEGKALSRKTDIWSWGLSILEMFMGEATWGKGHPRPGVLAPQVLEAHIEFGEDNDEIPPMPKELSDLLSQCFQKNPENRPETMAKIADALKSVYEIVNNIKYEKLQPEPFKLQGDHLNNRSVSYLDIGKEKEAILSWRKALNANPEHLLVNLNLGYFQWLKGQITDTEYLSTILSLQNKNQTNSEYWQTLACIHFERGDIEAIEEIEKYYPIENEKLKKVFREKDRPCGKLVKQIEVSGGSINSINLSPNGRYAVTGGEDGIIALIDFGGQKVVKQIDGHTDSVNSVCFSPDSRHVLSASSDNTVRLWDVYSGKELKIFKGHNSAIHSVCYSPDGRYGLSWGSDGQIRLLEILSGNLVRKYFFRKRKASNLCFTPDTKYILSAGDGTTVSLWEIRTGTDKMSYKGHRGSVTFVCFSPNGRYILSGSSDRSMRLWELETAEVIQEFKGHTEMVSSVSFSPDGHFILSGSSDGTVRLWEVSTGR